MVAFSAANNQVEAVMRKALCKSAPGPNGIFYAVYKQCPDIPKSLYWLLHVAWMLKYTCKEWRMSNGMYIPKEPNTKAIPIQDDRSSECRGKNIFLSQSKQS